MNTTPPLESLTARAWGMRVYTASPPGSPQYHSRGGLSGPRIRRYLSGKLSKPKPMAPNRPPLSRSRAALPLGFPYLCLGYLCLSVAPAAATPGLGQEAAAQHTDSSAIVGELEAEDGAGVGVLDRKSTRLNSSHSSISYAVFCLKKKKTQTNSYP